MRKSRTHFEQISLEVVKRIAVGDVSRNEKGGTGAVLVEPVSGKSALNPVPGRSLARKRRSTPR
jgi:hypothetical protein